jgi:CDP-diacylglycerol pyrophosphatase
MMSRIVFVVIILSGVIATGCEKPDPLWGKVYEECLERIYSGAGTPPARVVDKICRDAADMAVKAVKLK